MESLKTLRHRIRAVSNTMQLTKVMGLTSSSMFRQARIKLFSARPYAEKMQAILKNLFSASTTLNHPLFEKRESKRIGLVIVTSDRGLCGSYNVNVFRKAEEFLDSKPAEQIKLILIGKKGFNYFRKTPLEIRLKYLNLGGKLELVIVKKITSELLELFTTGEVNEIYLLYTEFKSAISYKVIIDKFLNVEPPADKNSEDNKSDPAQEKNKLIGYQEYIFEPSSEKLFESLLPRYCLNRIQIVLSEAFTSEQASRMIAMEAATKNAKEMIEHMTLLQNKARQSAITKEMLEIASGVEAMKQILS